MQALLWLGRRRISCFLMTAGKDLVLWRDGAGEWRCFADKCAHRNAPLSEGRIEPQNGSIMCSYHGEALGQVCSAEHLRKCMLSNRVYTETFP